MKETLLVIDDNDNLRENTAELLELAGYNVLTARNGKEGLELAQKDTPALILCDIMMPELDGYSVIKAIENIPKLSAIPFIFMTSKSEKSDFRKGMNMGADDYLTKPFGSDDLLNVVITRLKKNELHKNKLNGFERLNKLFEESESVLNSKLNIENYKRRKYRKKEIIFYEADIPNHFYYVLSGKVKTYKTNQFDREFIIDIFGEGEYLGYLSLFDNSGFKESAEAMEESELVLIPKEEFFELLFKHSELSVKFIKIISNDLAEAEEKLINLAYSSARKRVAEALLFLRSKSHAAESNEETYFTASREDISDLAGLAHESVSRNITDLKNENLIDSQNGKVKILNLEKFKNIKN